MSTYQEIFKMLKDELALKAKIHFNLDSQIAQNGDNGIDMEDYIKTQEEWLKASHNYTMFLAEIADKDINPNDPANLKLI